MSEAPATPEDLFARHPAGLAVWERVAQLAAALPGAEVRTSRSQVALRRRRAFAFVWRPGQYVRSVLGGEPVRIPARPTGRELMKTEKEEPK